MGDRRVSGWFVLSAVFIVLVFGLFFTFTERKSWPEHRIELGPLDMRLAPPVSTLWCESVSLHSDQSFVAYQVNEATRISSKRLNLQRVELHSKLGSSWNTNTMKLKYFLLTSSVIEVVGCSSAHGVKLLIFKGDLDVPKCLQSLVMKESSTSSGVDSGEDSTEEDDTELDYESVDSAARAMAVQKHCSSLITYRPLDMSYMDSYSTACNPSIQLSPVRVNVTTTDTYVIVAWNTNRQVTNHVTLELLLDRTRYTVHRTGQPFDLCSLSTTCTIGLGFASGDRVLVTMPENPNAGRSSFVVRARCKPRLAVFAILSVFLPLLLFVAVAFVVRADRDILGKICFRRKDHNRGGQTNCHRVIAPLLDDQSAVTTFVVPRERTEVEVEELPPPYHSLFDPPPPYAFVKEDGSKCSEER